LRVIENSRIIEQMNALSATISNTPPHSFADMRPNHTYTIASLIWTSLVNCYIFNSIPSLIWFSPVQNNIINTMFNLIFVVGCKATVADTMFFSRLNFFNQFQLRVVSIRLYTFRCEFECNKDATTSESNILAILISYFDRDAINSG